MNEVLGMLVKMIDLKNQLQEKYDACRKEDDDEDGRECDEDDEDVCPINLSLATEYDQLMTWAFGKWQGLGKSESRKLWKKLHPTLPVPRVLKERHAIPSQFQNTALIMDILPIYLKEKQPS